MAGGACDTQSSEQKLQPVQTRTKKGNLSSTKRVAILESDAWNDPSQSLSAYSLAISQAKESKKASEAQRRRIAAPDQRNNAQRSFNDAATAANQAL